MKPSLALCQSYVLSGLVKANKAKEDAQQTILDVLAMILLAAKCLHFDGHAQQKVIALD